MRYRSAQESRPEAGKHMRQLEASGAVAGASTVSTLPGQTLAIAPAARIEAEAATRVSPQTASPSGSSAAAASAAEQPAGQRDRRAPSSVRANATTWRARSSVGRQRDVAAAIVAIAVVAAVASTRAP